MTVSQVVTLLMSWATFYLLGYLHGLKDGNSCDKSEGRKEQ